jgi:fructosamine-3-kinase
VTVTPVAGGDINRALRAEAADGRTLFVKHGADAPDDVYRAEAEGLAWLAEARALPVPAVAAVGAAPGFLALEWIASAPAGRDHDERLGRGLARLHRHGAPRFGLLRDNHIGRLPQPNGALPDWPSFYAERRLHHMARLARDAGGLDRAAAALVERVCDRLPDLAGPPEPPARLHGDLWSGNAMTGPDGGPVLVDPAAYGGHREMDLATMRLFGGFSARVHAAYAEAWPLAAGHEDRVALWQLYPLLVHAAHFGGGYGRRAGEVAARYAGRARAE